MDKRKPKTRSIRPFTQERFETIVSLIGKSFNVPLKPRSLEQKRAVLQYYRAKSDFAVERGILNFRGKRVLLKDDMSGIVQNQFNHVQVSGARALKYSLQKKYTGISERQIQQELAKIKDIQANMQGSRTRLH